MIKKEGVISVIKIKVSEATNSANADILKGTRHIQEDLSTRGSLQSGTHISFVMNLATKTINDSCTELMDNIEILQQELNITYKGKELIKISELVMGTYQRLIEITIANHLKNVINTANGTFSMIETSLNGLKQNTNNIVKKKIAKIELDNRLKKDDPGLRQAKVANILAIIALVVSFISIYIAFSK